ncbi:inverse autotransporter beta domain-containing protein [Planctomicrobium sp. SH668]|uniref:inverse autotransporter beta domain-containing protein n=1 Tax=Planctomicrobium sp. SH668 TaxID=3448126 RepID=UPI003F5B429F
MRPMLAAKLFVLSFLPVAVPVAYAQQSAPRSFPEYHQVGQPGPEYSRPVAGAFHYPALNATAASTAPPPQGSRPVSGASQIVQVSGTTGPWTGGSRLSEPVAAPPATVVPPFNASQSRRTVVSAEHSILVNGPTHVPPLAANEVQPVSWSVPEGAAPVAPLLPPPPAAQAASTIMQVSAADPVPPPPEIPMSAQTMQHYSTAWNPDAGMQSQPTPINPTLPEVGPAADFSQYGDQPFLHHPGVDQGMGMEMSIDGCGAPSCGIPSCSIPSCSIPSCSIPSCSIPSCSIPSCGSPTCGAPSCSMPSCSSPMNCGSPMGADIDFGGPQETYRNLNYPDSMCQPPDPMGVFLPYVTGGTKLGNHRVISGGGFFIPLWQSADTLVFTDLRAYADDRDAVDGYIGLGARTYLDPEWIFGAYTYADLASTSEKNFFAQAQLGFELLTVDWDFRVNGYAPGVAHRSSNSRSGISNGTAITHNFRERLYPGVDFEIGKRLLHWGFNDQFELRGFLGGYQFGQSNPNFPEFGGARGRLEMRIYDLAWAGPQSRLEFGTEVSWDRVRDTQVFGFIRARFAFGGKGQKSVLDPLRRRMLDNTVHRID